MSDDATPRLSLPYLAAGQAQKHVTLNESLARLDGLVQTAVESRATDAQPASPDDGALYIMTAGASGTDWAGQDEGAVMRFEAGAWSAFAVAAGQIVYVKDEDATLVFDGAAWASLGVGDEIQDLALLGVNATADATNKLSVSSAAVLFNNAGGDSQVKVNKAAAGDTASHLFQTGFSGRAEFGLTGSDDFTIKVSPDGSAWHDVMSVARATGKATFTLSALRPSQVDVFTSSGTYSVPDWARRLKVVCIGAGGGGGSGAAGTNAAARGGGGGGGAGGRAEEDFDVAELGASLTVTVGAGASGGAAVTGATAGNAGGTGGDSYVQDGASYLVGAPGGAGGAGGSASAASGGAGGLGVVAGNMGATGAASGAAAAPSPTNGAGPGAGGGGAGMGTSTTTASGGDGGYGYSIGYGSGHRAAAGTHGTGASPAGGDGAAKAWTRGCGAGGGGGGVNSTSDGGNGGAGGAPGGGGGGGGGARDTFNSGKGKAGGRGEVWIIAIG